MAGKGRSIVLPVDASEHSERAFQWYLDNLRQDGDKLSIVGIIEPPSIPASFYSPVVVSDEYKANLDESIRRTTETVTKFESKCKDVGLPCTTITDSSDFGAGEKICQIAKDQKASGIVMGSRGLNIIRKTLLGSVSSYVVNHSHVPVVVTPPEQK